jgi:hypothetical protein
MTMFKAEDLLRASIAAVKSGPERFRQPRN